MIDPTPIRARFASLSPHLDERERRLLAATEARLAGYGGIAAVVRATGVAASTIGRGLRELATQDLLDPGRVRRGGGGRRPLTVTDPELLPTLLSLVEPDEFSSHAPDLMLEKKFKIGIRRVSIEPRCCQ